MSEYNLRITDIDWTKGNMYETSQGFSYVVRNSNLVEKKTGRHIGEDYALESIAKLTFKRVVDWTKVPVDTKVLVSEGPTCWLKRHFAKYKNGRVYCFSNGKTSWSSDDALTASWLYAKLAEEGE